MGRSPPSGRIEPIQWLRGVAAMLVLFVHAVAIVREQGGAVMPGIPNLATFGASGVDLFFVISGVVMAQSLALLPARAVAGFLWARWLRIVPLFVLVSAAFLAIDQHRVAWQSILTTVTILPVFSIDRYFVPALFVGWTLGFEFAFYALVAIAAAMSGGRRVGRLLALTLGAGVAGLVVHPGWPPLRLLLNPLQLEFAIGVGVWLAWRAGWTRRLAGPALVAGIALLTVGLAFGLGLPFTAHFDAAVDGSSGLARSWTWGLPWALITAGLVDEGSRGRIAAAMRRIGDASYASYLVHPCLIALMARLGLVYGAGRPLLTVAALVLAWLGAGLLLHRWIERPLLAWLRRPRQMAPVVALA